MRKSLFRSGAAIFAVFILPSLSFADPAVYDPSFRGDGSGDDAHGTSPQGNGVAIDSKGRIVVVGTAINPGAKGKTNISVIRYLNDGSLDTSFGTGGKVFVTNLNYDERGAAVAIDSSDRIVVVGDRQYSSDPNLPDKDILVIRLLDTGALDGSFGTNGKYRYGEAFKDDFGTAVVIDASGRIVVGGVSDNPNATASKSWDLTFLRLSAVTGSLDQTFGSNGVRHVDQYSNGYYEYLTGLALDASGRIYASMNVNSWCGVIRLTSAGAPDASYGQVGVANWLDNELGGTQKWTTGIKVDSNGKAVVCGSQIIAGKTKIFVARYSSDGISHDWVTQTDFGGNSEKAYALAIQPNNQKIVVVGSSSEGPGIAVIRYLPDGSLDPEFNAPYGGFADNPTGNPGETARGIAIQSNLKYVIAGSHDTEFLVARIRGDCSDSDFYYDQASYYYNYFTGKGDSDSALAYYSYFQAFGDQAYYKALGYNEYAELKFYQGLASFYYHSLKGSSPSYANYCFNLYSGYAYYYYFKDSSPSYANYYLNLYYAYAYYNYFTGTGDAASASLYYDYYYNLSLSFL